MARVLIIDDHDLFRAGMVLLLRQFHPDSELLQAPSVAAALTDAAVGAVVDVVLMDWHLPLEDPVLNVQRLKTQWPLARLVVVSGNEAPPRALPLMAMGISAYVSKATSPEAFIAALNAIMLGAACTLPSAAAREGEESTGWGDMFGPDSPIQRRIAERLTVRQKQVVVTLLRGGSNKHIAREMDISEETVKKHLNATYEALGVHGRTELLALLMQSRA